MKELAMQSISYTYDATGRKLRMQTSPTAVFNYQDGIEYNNGVLSQINTEEGRAIKVASNAYNYEYTLTDHLGNNRVSFDTYGTNTTRKVGEESYYPFGLNVHRLVNALIATPKTVYDLIVRIPVPNSSDPGPHVTK